MLIFCVPTCMFLKRLHYTDGCTKIMRVYSVMVRYEKNIPLPGGWQAYLRRQSQLNWQGANESKPFPFDDFRCDNPELTWLSWGYCPLHTCHNNRLYIHHSLLALKECPFTNSGQFLATDLNLEPLHRSDSGCARVWEDFGSKHPWFSGWFESQFVDVWCLFFVANILSKLMCFMSYFGSMAAIKHKPHPMRTWPAFSSTRVSVMFLLMEMTETKRCNLPSSVQL